MIDLERNYSKSNCEKKLEEKNSSFKISQFNNSVIPQLLIII